MCCCDQPYVTCLVLTSPTRQVTSSETNPGNILAIYKNILGIFGPRESGCTKVVPDPTSPSGTTEVCKQRLPEAPRVAGGHIDMQRPPIPEALHDFFRAAQYDCEDEQGDMRLLEHMVVGKHVYRRLPGNTMVSPFSLQLLLATQANVNCQVVDSRFVIS